MTYSFIQILAKKMLIDESVPHKNVYKNFCLTNFLINELTFLEKNSFFACFCAIAYTNGF